MGNWGICTSSTTAEKTTKKDGTGATNKFTIPPDWGSRCATDRDWCQWFIHNLVKEHMKPSSAPKRMVIDEDRLEEIKKGCKSEDGDEDYKNCIEEKKYLEYYAGPAERSGLGGGAGLDTTATIAIVAVSLLVAIGVIIGSYCLCFGSRTRGGGGASRKSTSKSHKKSAKWGRSSSKKSKSVKSNKSSKVGSKKSKKSIKSHKTSKKGG